MESEQTPAAPEPVELTNTGISSGRVTIKEIWQIIAHLKRTIEEYITLIHATQTELRERKRQPERAPNSVEKLKEGIVALRAKRRPDTATMAANINEKDVLRASERAVWNSAVNIRLETFCARRQPQRTHRNIREQTPNSTTKHHEIEDGDGSTHQRPSKPETRGAPDPDPSITAYRTYVNHSVWRRYQPRVESDLVRFRSLIYVNLNLSTSSHW